MIHIHKINLSTEVLSMPNVLFLTSLAPEITSLFTQYTPDDFTVNVQSISLPEEQQIALAKEADFLILFPSKISDNVLRAAKRLKLIQLVSVGFDQMNLDLCRQLYIHLANNGGTNSIDVAEHTLAMVLAFYQRFAQLDHNVRTNQWRAIDSGKTTYTIHNKTAGIIGMGQIGQKVARLMNAFGAKVIYYDAYPQSEQVEQELGITRTTLDDLLQQADIVTLHVPLLPATQGLIGARELTLMKSNAILVNTCRGPVVDEAALTEALSQNQIGGATLDVLLQEPPASDNPILGLDNVLFTPHTAGVTYDTWPRRGEFIFQNIQRVWRGEAPLATVT